MMSSTIAAMCPTAAALQASNRPSANAPGLALPKGLRRRAGAQIALRMVK